MDWVVFGIDGLSVQEVHGSDLRQKNLPTRASFVTISHVQRCWGSRKSRYKLIGAFVTMETALQL